VYLLNIYSKRKYNVCFSITNNIKAIVIIIFCTHFKGAWHPVKIKVQCRTQPNRKTYWPMPIFGKCQISADIQWVRKVFRPPYIFHSLLYCSHLLKSFNFIFFLNVNTAPHIDRKTQNCWHFCWFFADLIFADI